METKIIACCAAMALLLSILKLTHVIAWSWATVLFPLWFPLAAMAAAAIAFLLIVVIYAFFPTERL